MSYHLKEIKKGILGEFSKIREEFEELEDAHDQDARIMELNELSDLVGAIEAYAETKLGSNLIDLIKMKDLTKRAFESGRRT